MSIKIENVVLASPEQMGFIIQGMRNPTESWDQNDSRIRFTNAKWPEGIFVLGESDRALMQLLSTVGEATKLIQMMPVYARITAPLYFWNDFDDVYKDDTVSSYCSIVNTIRERNFTLDDFSTEHLAEVTTSHNIEMTGAKAERLRKEKNIEVPIAMCDMQPIDMLQLTIDALNVYRNLYLGTENKVWWRQIIQLLPNSYNQTRNVMVTYEVLANIYKSRKNHELDEWRELCKWIEYLPYSELIIADSGFKKNSQK